MTKKLTYENMDTGWDPNVPEKEPVSIQGLRVGKIFRRKIPDGETGFGKRTTILQDRRVRIVQSYNPNTGVITFTKNLPFCQHAQDFPEIGLTDNSGHDLAEEGSPSFRTVRKHGASKAHRKLPPKGNPDFRIPKPANSFLLNKTPHRVAIASRKHKK